MPHLSYVGDADLGEDVNVGAGTVTINYDGYAKHRTVIEDGSRIGSDTMLVAPVRVGRDAVTGAGSVITKDVPPGSLAVERTEQRNVQGYRERKEAQTPPRQKRGGASVEIITKKRMMLYSGTIHPTLAHEIADNLGIPVSEGEIRRFASGEIYFRAEDPYAAPTCSSCRPITSP